MRHALRRPEAHGGLKALALALVVLASLAADVSPTARAQESSLIEFEIKDQFNRKHMGSEFESDVLIVVSSDRKGSEYNGAWDDAIRAALAPEFEAGAVAILPVADVRGVPFFLKRTVRGRFPQEPSQWVLLDWSGAFAKAYGHDKDSCNVTVFGRDRQLALGFSGRELEADQVDLVARTVRELLAESSR